MADIPIKLPVFALPNTPILLLPHSYLLLEVGGPNKSLEYLIIKVLNSKAFPTTYSYSIVKGPVKSKNATIDLTNTYNYYASTLN